MEWGGGGVGGGWGVKESEVLWRSGECSSKLKKKSIWQREKEGQMHRIKKKQDLHKEFKCWWALKLQEGVYGLQLQK